ncbi:MAG: hypothetical protein NTY09_12300 [bacterium]|nr:hypothetical protein [bacterium]
MDLINLFPFFVLVGLPVLITIGLGLLELTIEFFTSPPPGMGIVYRDTRLSNSITRAILSDEPPRLIRTRPRPIPEPDPETVQPFINVSPDPEDKFS